MKFFKDDLKKTQFSESTDIPVVVQMRKYLKCVNDFNIIEMDSLCQFTVIRKCPLPKTTSHQVDLYFVSCDCGTFLHTCRSCAHVFAAIHHLACKEEWKFQLKDPMHVLHMVHLWYHDRCSFDSGSIVLTSAYPITGPKISNPQNGNPFQGDVELFEIEFVLGLRKTKMGLQVFVKWRGYSSGGNSWIDYNPSNLAVVREFCIPVNMFFEQEYLISLSVDNEEQYDEHQQVCLILLKEVGHYEIHFGKVIESSTENSEILRKPFNCRIAKFFKEFNVSF